MSKWICIMLIVILFGSPVKVSAHDSLQELSELRTIKRYIELIAHTNKDAVIILGAIAGMLCGQPDAHRNLGCNEIESVRRRISAMINRWERQ